MATSWLVFQLSMTYRYLLPPRDIRKAIGNDFAKAGHVAADLSLTLSKRGGPESEVSVRSGRFDSPRFSEILDLIDRYNTARPREKRPRNFLKGKRCLETFPTRLTRMPCGPLPDFMLDRRSENSFYSG